MDNVNVPEKKRKYKKNHILGEMKNCRLVAAVIIVCVFLYVLFYVLASLPLHRTVYVEDEYNAMLGDEGVERVRSVAEDLSKKHNINVVVITAYKHAYFDSRALDSDAKAKADECYKKHCGNPLLGDNAGICIVIDPLRDDRNKILRIYAYGNAKYAVDGSMRNQVEKLRIVTQYPKVDYDKTVIQALMLLNEEGSFHGIGEIVSVVLCILIPLGFAAMVTRAAVVEKEYKSPPASYNYLASRKMIERKDEPSSRIADFLGL